MPVFNIHPLNRFKGLNTTIRRPKEIAFFSYDDEHQYHPDGRSIRYYYPPRLGSDLSSGFDTFQKLDDTTDDHLDSLLKTIITLEEQSGGTHCDVDIITWRGMMTKLTVLIERDHGHPIRQFRQLPDECNKISTARFIEEDHEFKLEFHRGQQSQPSRPGAASQDMMTYWGYKFETLSLMPNQWDDTTREYIEGREELVVNNSAQYCSLARTGFGKTKIIIGGEVDGLWDAKPESKDEPANWVELKTSAEIENDRDMLKYERKLLKIWIQSFLLGVPKIIVGFRSKRGILQKLEELETKNIPNMVLKNGKGTWDGNTCINFTASFLEWLKSTINSEGVWKIKRKERSSVIEVFKVEECGQGDIISKEFITWRNRDDGKE